MVSIARGSPPSPPFCCIALFLPNQVTWDSSFFYSGATVQIEVEYSTSDITSGISGFSTSAIDASKGFYVWAIDSSFLTMYNASYISATIYAAYADTSNKTERATGPTVVITASTLSPSSSSGHHVSALAVALPVVLGIAALVILGFCAWSWRRYGRVLPCCGGETRTVSFLKQTGMDVSSVAVPSAAVGGSGKAEPATATDIQLTDRDSWSPTRGTTTTNGFRAELKRQEEESKWL